MDLPLGRSPITYKWTFKCKYHSNGFLARFKARLVARGFSQVEGLDYTKTFSHVVCMASLCVLLAFAAIHDLHVH